MSMEVTSNIKNMRIGPATNAYRLSPILNTARSLNSSMILVTSLNSYLVVIGSMC